MNHPAARFWAVIAVAGWACSAAFAVDPPDLRINVLSGLIETVDATWSGANYNVRYTVMNGAGQQSGSILLTTNSANDLDPRISISTAGDAYVAWWRDTAANVIVFRRHTYATQAWSAEIPVGIATESNSRPRLAYGPDGHLNVAYQIQSKKSKSVAAQIIDDDPEPMRAIVATTTNMGDLDIQIQAVSGHLWITWIDTSQRVGYSEFVYEKGMWSVPSYQSYAIDSVATARARIQALIVSGF
jgi:hypothetical protein